MGSASEHRPGSQRDIDEALTHRVELFLDGRLGLPEPFSAAQLAHAIGIDRFGEQDAERFLAALRTQGRVDCDGAGWYLRPLHPW